MGCLAVDTGGVPQTLVILQADHPAWAELRWHIIELQLFLFSLRCLKTLFVFLWIFGLNWPWETTGDTNMCLKRTLRIFTVCSCNIKVILGAVQCTFGSWSLIERFLSSFYRLSSVHSKFPFLLIIWIPYLSSSYFSSVNTLPLWGWCSCKTSAMPLPFSLLLLPPLSTPLLVFKWRLFSFSVLPFFC